MAEKPVALDLRDVPFSDPRVTINKIPRMVSSRVGLIQRIQEVYFCAQDPVMLSMGVGSADLARVTDIQNASKAGGGGEKLETALAATIGEMVERYCMYWFDRKNMVKGAYRDLADDALSPHTLRLYSEQQVRDKPPNVDLEYFTDDTPINWVWAYSLTRSRSVLVPASFVYMGYDAVDGELVVGRNTSTGLAAGATLEEAVLSGLMEVIERDAFAISWLRRRVSAAIDIDDAMLAANLRTRFRTDHASVDLRFYDITLDIRTPCVFGVLRRPSEFGPVLCVASVARTCPREAILKCAREIGQGIPYLRYLRDQLVDWEPAADYRDVRTFDHHYMLYSKRPELIERNLTFCDKVTEEIRLSALPDISTGRPVGDINRLIAMLAELGHEVIALDITTPDVREVGLHVVRVLVPGLVPLHGNHNFPYLGVDRLYNVPKKLQWAERGWDPESGINPDPHPFP